jgi:protoheme IX farnesyltransferase
MLWPATLAPWLLGFAGALYGACAGVLSLLFTACAVRVWRDTGHAADRAARHMFHFSLVYLFLIFTVLLAEHIAGGGR